MTDFGGKLPGKAVRLAGLLHICQGGDHRDAIDLATVESALSLAATLSEHAKAAYSFMGADPSQACAKAILAWLTRANVATFTCRDALRAVQSRYPTMESVQAGLETLLARSCLIAIEQDENRRGRGRRPSTTYAVNPVNPVNGRGEQP